MDKITLYVDVEGLVARNRNPDQTIVCKNEEYQIEFNFDSAWDAYSDKTARFLWNNEYHDVGFTGNVCPVPQIQGTPYVTVGVYVDDVIRTTTGAEIRCNPSILCYKSEPSAGNDERYRNEAKEAAEEAKQARDEISEMFDGITHIAPQIGENGNWFVEDIDTGVRAAGIDGLDGKDGKDGADGITPHVGANGNWFVGDEDTGVKATGDKGEKGDRGEQGERGEQGIRGEKGDRGERGLQGIQGVQGVRGEKGDKGDRGEAGKTPQVGVDYFTTADKAEIVQSVLNALPNGDEVSY